MNYQNLVLILGLRHLRARSNINSGTILFGYYLIQCWLASGHHVKLLASDWLADSWPLIRCLTPTWVRVVASYNKNLLNDVPVDRHQPCNNPNLVGSDEPRGSGVTFFN